MTHAHYMSLALSLAAKGIGHTAPNPLVGAVVVKDGKVVGTGYHERFGMAHAEVNAIDDAGADASGATLYVTLEPCNHFGKTPPCTGKIIEAGLSTVVVAVRDPNPTASGGVEKLEENGIEVIVGVHEDDAVLLNEAYFKFVKTGMPFVTLKCAATLDGYIATSTGDSKWITGERSRKFVHGLRHGNDAILVGSGTVREDDPTLTTRFSIPDKKDPIRIVLDTNLSVDMKAKIFNGDSDAGVILATGPDIDEEKKKAIESRDAVILELPLAGKRIDIRQLLLELGKMNITSVLVEGGSRVAGSFLRSGHCDKVCLFYAPKFLGGDDGIPVISGKGPEKIKDLVGLRDVSIEMHDGDILVQGYPDK